MQNGQNTLIEAYSRTVKILDLNSPKPREKYLWPTLCCNFFSPAYSLRELWIEPKNIVTSMTNPTTTFNEDVHSDVGSDGYLRPNPIIEKTVGGDK